MIHFTCDGCDRRIDTAHEPRYVLRLEVYSAAAADDEATPGEADFTAADNDRDHLAEIEDLLESVDDFEGDPLSGLADDYRQARYDLCGACRERMLSNPLGRLAVSKIGFSEN